jgi:hypothetical protein
MTQVTIKVPHKLATLPLAEQDSLLRAGLFEAVRSRMRQLASEIEESKQHIEQYEKKYGISLSQFEVEQLPELDTLQAHEDYNDWFFWRETLRQNQQIMNELQKAVVD